MSFIKDREPAAVAAFFLAAVQGLYVIAGAFGHKLATGQWEAITAFLMLVAGFLVRGNVTSNATLAKMKASAASLVALIAAVFFTGCSPAAMQEVVNVASEAVKIAQVLCLADQAKKTNANAREFSVQELCKTDEQLAPYLPAAKDPSMLAARAGECP